MKKSAVGKVCGISSAVLIALMVVCTISNVSLAADSCVTCHTDIDILKENLSKEEKKKSSMQAGPG